MTDRPSATPVALAATAEAGVIALVVHLLLEGARVTDLGLGVFVGAFWVVFTGATVLVWRVRDWEPAGPACVVAAVLAGLALGGGTLQSTVVSVMVAVAVAARVATLALRDWREPEPTAPWIGGIAVGLEALAAGSIQRSWGGALVVVVPVFFAASLASRAAIVWSDQPSGAVRVRQSGRLAAGLGLVSVAAVLAGGTIDRMAGWLAPAGRALIALAAWALSQVLRPVFWAFERANVDTEAATDLLERIRRSSEAAGRAARERTDPNGGGGWFARVVGALFLVGLTVVAVRLFRRFRTTPSRGRSPMDAPAESVEQRVPADDGQPSAGIVPRRHARRSDDAVRAAYGEVLTALGTRGVAKPRDQTPAEFARELATRYPETAEPFEALTRAYEDVRYGAANLAADALSAVDRQRRSLLTMIRRFPPPVEA